MIDYFVSAEATLRLRATLDETLKDLRDRRDTAIAFSAPAGYPTTSFRNDGGYSGTRRINDAIAELVDLAEILREIKANEKERDRIDRALNALSEEDHKILRLWYIEQVGADEVMEQMHYASRTTITDKRNRAVFEFAIRYFGAGAVKA